MVYKWSLQFWCFPPVSAQLFANESVPDHVGFARVKINLINENDNRPIFSQVLYNVSLFENVTVGTTVLTIHVSSDILECSNVALSVLLYSSIKAEAHWPYRMFHQGKQKLNILQIKLTGHWLVMSWGLDTAIWLLLGTDYPLCGPHIQADCLKNCDQIY